MCTKVQNSSVSLLISVVNNMLDYGQLSAGKFQKIYSKFDLVQALDEIIDVVSFKAN